MSWTPQAAILPDGRLHLQQGPIDLVVDAEGPGRAAALARARDAFDGVLEGLVAELLVLRAAAAPAMAVQGPVARRMLAAVTPHLPVFITPMAAVAGAVADHVLAEMTHGTGLRKAYVNNGGDIAVHLSAGARFRAAMTGGVVEIGSDDPWRGVATSGRGGRSHSLGIADAVTVLAETAAQADAAATLIANAVDLPGHPAVERTPARLLSPDSDLGGRLVTIGVGALAPGDVAQALEAGLDCAAAMRRRGLIGGAALALRGQVRVAGAFPVLEAV